MLNQIQALLWDFFLTPYYKVRVFKGNKIIKIFNQKIMGEKSVDGEDIALIDWSNKLSWFITNDYYIHKSRIMYDVDISNAMPLKIDDIKTIIEEKVSGLIIKETIIKKTSINKEKLKENENKIKRKIDGKPKIKTQPILIPTLHFEMINGRFVKLVIKEPPSKWAELKWVLIAGILVLGFILWQFSGVITKGV